MLSNDVPPSAAHGRHRRSRRRSLLVASTLAVASAVGVVATASTRGEGSASGCAEHRDLSVVAAVELVPAIESAATAMRCVRVHVSAGESSTVARQVADGAAPSDVWIPDSSRWVTGLDATSVAWSPVVLAVPANELRQWDVPATFEGIAQAFAAGTPLVLTADEAAGSATTQATLSELGDALGTTPTLRGHLAALVRSMSSEPSVDRSRLLPVRAMTEQGVWTHNRDDRAPGLRAVYPPAAALALDYPLVLTATTTNARTDARELLGALTQGRGAAAVERLGFRSPLGRASSRHTSTEGVDPARGNDASPLTRSRAASALRLLATMRRGSRVLALIDVSGSMAQPIPGLRSVSRIELARTAVRGAVKLFPEGTVAGLWRFSSDLTPSTNYEQLMPLTPLTARSRRDFARATERLSAVPNGGTGLYDSVLAAVRYVRSGYDASRVNSVVVLSDGKNEYASAHGITKATLLTALRGEADAERPVPVVAVAYGPDSDVAALRSISTATGGSLFTSRNPRDLPVIFRDAIGHRVCQPEC